MCLACLVLGEHSSFSLTLLTWLTPSRLCANKGSCWQEEGGVGGVSQGERRVGGNMRVSVGFGAFIVLQTPPIPWGAGKLHLWATAGAATPPQQRFSEAFSALRVGSSVRWTPPPRTCATRMPGIFLHHSGPSSWHLSSFLFNFGAEVHSWFPFHSVECDKPWIIWERFWE